MTSSAGMETLSTRLVTVLSPVSVVLYGLDSWSRFCKPITTLAVRPSQFQWPRPGHFCGISQGPPVRVIIGGLERQNVSSLGGNLGDLRHGADQSRSPGIPGLNVATDPWHFLSLSNSKYCTHGFVRLKDVKGAGLSH